jgi:hypothetical protein
MTILYNFAQDRAEEIPEERVTQAIASGVYGLKKGGVVALTDRKGALHEVPTEEAHLKIINEGFSYPTTRQHEKRLLFEEAGKHAGEAALAELVSTSTLGLSDAVMAYTDKSGRSRDWRRALQEANPVSTALGAVAGAVMPVGAGGLAAKAGTLAKTAAGAGLRKAGIRSVAANAAATVGAAGAAEGAIFGAGHLFSEEALGKADYGAQSIAAHVGLGTLIGASFGGALGLAGELGGRALTKGAEKVAKKIEARSPEGVLVDIKRDSVLDAVGITKAKRTAMAKKKSPYRPGKSRLDDAADGLLEIKHPDGKPIVQAFRSKAHIAPRIGDTAENAGVKIGDFIETLDKNMAKSPMKIEAGDWVSSQRIAERIRKEIIEELSGRPERASVMNRMTKAADAYADEAAEWTFARAQKLKNDYGAAHRKNFADPLDLNDARRKVERIFNDEIERAAEQASKKFMPKGSFSEYKMAKRIYATLIDVADASADAAVGEQALRAFSLTDTIAGAGGVVLGAPTGGLGGIAYGAAAAFGSKILRERGRSAVAVVADKMTRLDTMSKAIMATENRVAGSLSSFLRRSGVETKAGIFKRARMAMKGGKWAAEGEAAKETRRAIGAPASIQILMRTKLLSESEQGKTRAEAARFRAEEISKIVASPQMFADRIASVVHGVEQAAPELAGQLAMTTARAMQFLNQKAPSRGYDPDSLQPMLDDIPMSDYEVAKFERYLAAVLDPLSVFDDLAAGRLSPEGVESLQAVYPALYEKAREVIAETLAGTKKRIPMDARVELSLLFGFPVDGTMKPESIALSQQNYARKPAQGRGTGGVRLRGIERIDPSRLASDSDKLAAKD